MESDNKRIMLLFILCIMVMADVTLSEPKPSWLDTIAPVILVKPAERIHSRVFSITMTNSERGTIWYRFKTDDKFKQYKKPFSFTRDDIYLIYFFGEDDFGNKTSVDSVSYILDSKPPKLDLSPKEGAFKSPVYLYAASNEKCSYYISMNDADTIGIKFYDSVLIKVPDPFRVIAIDTAGNKAISKKMKYIIDTTSLKVVIDPKSGIYNRLTYINFKYGTDVTVWYTFDPLASPRWFVKYENQFPLPHGLSSIRYFAKSKSGITSEIFNTRYIVDTIPPKLNKRIANGNRFDTLSFSSRERSSIRFTRDGTLPTTESELYLNALIIPRTGIQRLKARAWDEAGNSSEIIEWEYKYDFTAPILSVLTKGGTFRSPFTLNLATNEPAKIFYTLDRSKPDENSLLYTNKGILISREDSTILRAFALDSAGNASEVYSEFYYLDTEHPYVKVRIDGTLQSGLFKVSLTANEPASIHYEIGGKEPTKSSEIYTDPIQMSSGQVLKYFAIDRVGNIGQIGVMDELRKPMVEANPGGGIHNRKLNISFMTNAPGTVYWRLLPDTTFKAASESVILDREGIHTFEYYLVTDGGLRGSIYRQEYVLDWTPPSFEISIRKGMNDSAIVFIRSNERATFYYTTDGTNPQVSSTTGAAGNRYLQNSDRLVFKRREDMKLAIYAQDAAGNQSSLSVLDIFSPHAIPDIPAGTDRLYNKVLSITFNTFDDAVIYFTTDGSVPTRSSNVFSKPLTLLSSDTIMTMVVDAMGYIGTIDTFIYRIDLPPTSLFTFSPDTVFKGDIVTFDASQSFDKESDSSKLKFSWDFDGDGKFDTDTLTSKIVSHKFDKAGLFKVILNVYDSKFHATSVENVCIVRERCPVDMVSVVNEDGTQFCIDLYEWPNLKNTVPQTGVSWVEAKMSCIDAGKRLCSASEWQSACQGLSGLVYPYGDIYQNERCPAEVNKVQKSGVYSLCKTNGVFDMIGNVWEWVEDKNGDYPFSYGGSFRYGKLARCNLKSEGSVASQSKETGFRCCK